MAPKVKSIRKQFSICLDIEDWNRVKMDCAINNVHITVKLKSVMQPYLDSLKKNRKKGI